MGSCTRNDEEMKMGICKECFEDVPLAKEFEIDHREYSDDCIYECPHCSYPNGIKCGDFHEVFDNGL